jgi:thiamine biosynthesis lipoprotein
VYLTDPEMSLDVGAIAKGYATEQVARIAEENGIESCLISVGAMSVPSESGKTVSLGK